MVEFRFLVVERWDQVLPVDSSVTVVLRANSWNDYNFETLYGIEILLPNNTAVDLGGVKILKRGQVKGPAEFNPGQSFSRLPASYCSLGQDIEYYEKLRSSIPDSVRNDFLVAIRDVVADPTIAEAFQAEEGWQTSLLRFGAAEHALSAGYAALQGNSNTQDGRAQFTFVRHTGSPLQIPFSFDGSGPLPGRCNVVIGYNGVGKTHLLAEIAAVASKVGDSSRASLEGADTTFGAVITVAYSAFDSFEIPDTSKDTLSGGLTGEGSFEAGESGANTTFFGYTYCGLRSLEAKTIRTDQRRRHELKSLNTIDGEFLGALEKARNRDEGEQALREALDIVAAEPSFGRIGIEPSVWIDDHALASSQIKALSAGHKIVANIIVQLAAHLRDRSLVLIDEPETHLHPSLLAALVRAIQRLLDAYDSFAIIATHSPVLLQEVQASNVQVLVRFGAAASTAQTTIETFGENVGEITRDVFSLDSSSTDYQGVLKALALEYEVDEIEDLFQRGLGLSSQARALVLRARRNGGD